MEVAARGGGLGVSRLSSGATIGVAAPAGVTALSELALQRFPGVDVAMHFHDTRGLGVANAESALEAGVRHLEGSIGGIGGCPFAPNSTGNVCSEDMLAMVEDLGFSTGVDVGKLAQAAVDLEAALGDARPGKLRHAGPAPGLAAPPPPGTAAAGGGSPPARRAA